MADDLDKMQLSAPQRTVALQRCRRQLDQWGLNMPPVEPLVLDFGQGKFDQIGLIEFWIANELQAGYCGKYLFLFDGQQCPSHRHHKKHETFFVVKGAVRMTYDNRRQTLREGRVLPVPSGTVHGFTGVGNVLLLELSTPCLVSDNQFQDPAVAQWLTSTLQRT